MKWILLILLAAVLSACQSDDAHSLKAENTVLNQEIAALKAELEDIKSKSWYYLGQGLDRVDENDLNAAGHWFREVISKFPNDRLATSSADMLDQLGLNGSNHGSSMNAEILSKSNEDVRSRDENVLESISAFSRELKLSRGTGENYSVAGVFAKETVANGSLCTRLERNGWCEPGLPSIHFSFGLLSRDQERLVFDLQGELGCLTAQSDRFGEVFAVSLHGGPCVK